jgi:hypothetical protein
MDVDAPSFGSVRDERLRSKEITFVGRERDRHTATSRASPACCSRSRSWWCRRKTPASQSATFSATNAANMFASRIYTNERSERRRRGSCTRTCYAQIVTLSLASRQRGRAACTRPTSVATTRRPMAASIGRPLLPVEYCTALGTLGDVAHVGPPRSTSSPISTAHAGGVDPRGEFLTGQRAHSASRTASPAMPIWGQKVTPKNGTNTVSPTVVLEAR